MRIVTLKWLRISLLLFALCAVSVLTIHQPTAITQAADATPEARGLHNLTHNAYGAPLLNLKLLEIASKVWEPEWKTKLDANDPDSLRKVAFERYGFSAAVTNDNQGAPLQFVAQCSGAGRPRRERRSRPGQPGILGFQT